MVQSGGRLGATRFGRPADKLQGRLSQSAVRSDPRGAALAIFGLLTEGSTKSKQTATAAAQSLRGARTSDGAWGANGNADSSATALVLQALAKTGARQREQRRGPHRARLPASRRRATTARSRPTRASTRPATAAPFPRPRSRCRRIDALSAPTLRDLGRQDRPPGPRPVPAGGHGRPDLEGQLLRHHRRGLRWSRRHRRSPPSTARSSRCARSPRGRTARGSASAPAPRATTSPPTASAPAAPTSASRRATTTSPTPARSRAAAPTAATRAADSAAGKAADIAKGTTGDTVSGTVVGKGPKLAAKAGASDTGLTEPAARDDRARRPPRDALRARRGHRAPTPGRRRRGLRADHRRHPRRPRSGARLRHHRHPQGREPAAAPALAARRDARGRRRPDRDPAADPAERPRSEGRRHDRRVRALHAGEPHRELPRGPARHLRRMPPSSTPRFRRRSTRTRQPPPSSARSCSRTTPRSRSSPSSGRTSTRPSTT